MIENECNHIWLQIESDMNGMPTKYQCSKCLLVFNLPNRDIKISEYKANRDSIMLRIEQNNRKISLFNALNDCKDKTLVINHLQNENLKLDCLLSKYRY